jgi:hypothetical protein
MIAQSPSQCAFSAMPSLLAQHFRQGALAVFDRRAPHILAVRLDQIERAKYGSAVVLAVAE